MQDPLSTALCPTLNCTAVSHLACLSKHFLSSETTHTSLVPRGGQCTSCHTYTLWGDIVRGCYRRLTRAGDDGISENQSEMYDSDTQDVTSPSAPIASKRKGKSTSRTSRKATIPTRFGQSTSEGEGFDLNVSSTDSSSDENTPRKRGRPRKITPIVLVGSVYSSPTKPLSTTRTPIASRKRGLDTPRSVNIRDLAGSSSTYSSKPTNGKQYTTLANSSGELFDSDSISNDSDNLPISPGKAFLPQVVRSFLPLSSPLKQFGANKSPLHRSTKPDRDAVASLVHAVSSLSISSPLSTFHQYIEISD